MKKELGGEKMIVIEFYPMLTTGNCLFGSRPFGRKSDQESVFS
jgi:hypothetical protein